MRESSARFHRAPQLAACAAFAGGVALAPPGFTRALAPAKAPVVFAALGDAGTGDAAQYDTARAMVRTGAIVETGTILTPLAPASQVPDLPLPDNPTPPEERDPQTPCVPGNEGVERMLDGRCS